MRFFSKPSIEEVTYSDFLIVYHFWFVDSKYFKQTYHHNISKQEALKEALLFKHKHEETFNKCAFTIIDLKEVNKGHGM